MRFLAKDPNHPLDIFMMLLLGATFAFTTAIGASLASRGMANLAAFNAGADASTTHYCGAC